MKLFKFFITILVLIVGICISLSIGSTEHLLSYPKDKILVVLFDIRFLQIAAGVLVGICLGTSGVLSQGMFRNALASPDILGVSAASVLGVVICYILGFYSSLVSFGFSFIFASIIALFLSFLYRYSFYSLLLIGISLSLLCSSVSSLLVSSFIFQNKNIYSLLYWLYGDIIINSWRDIIVLLIPATLMWYLGLILAKKLDVLSLGEETSITLGINVTRLKIMLIFVISTLISISVAIAGGLSFIALIAPHITRLMWGPKHKRLYLISGINGASLVVYADIIHKLLINSYKNVQLGIITSFLGACFFLGILISQLKQSTSK